MTYRRRAERAVLAAAALAVLALPAAAQAATICVPATGPGCDSFAATPQAAADAAVEGDVIRIAAGEFPGVVTGKRLTFVGVGAGTTGSSAGTTVLSGTTAAPDALRLDHGGVVRALRAVGAAGSATHISGAGINVFVDDPTSHDLTLEDVIAQGGPAGDQWGGGSGVQLTHLSGGGGTVVPAVTVRGGAVRAGDGEAFVGIPPGPGEPPYYRPPDPALFLNGRLFNASVTATRVRGGLMRNRPGGLGVGVYVYGGQLALERVTAEGDSAVRIGHAGARIRLSTLSGQRAGLEVRPDGAMMGPIEVVDSLVTAVPLAGQAGQAALWVSAPTAGTARVLLRGSTFYGRGAVAAGYAQDRPAGRDGNVAATLRNTLVLAANAPASAVDLLVSGGTVDAAFSAYRTYRLAKGGSAPPPGSGTNVGASPLISARLVPLPGSPLVDAGDPRAVRPGEVDRLGHPRSVDGDGDCVARPDIGAFERPAIACNPLPVISGFHVTRHTFAPERRRGAARASRARDVPRGTRFRFRLSERARVTITISRLLPGRRVRVHNRARCTAPTRSNRGARRCLRVRRVGAIAATRLAGRRSVRFSGRMRGRALPRGRYRATIVARDGLRARSKPRSVRLRIVRPGRPRG